MFSRRPSQGVFASLAAFSVLVMASAARADTSIIVNTVSISRTVPLRPNTTTSLWISRSDCLANDVMTFPIVATGYTGSLEVWASNGASCLPPEARNTSAAQCWKVFSGAFTQSVFSVPIRTQDIAAEHRPPEFPESIGDQSSCTPPVGTASAAQPITLFFMDVLGDQNQGGSAWQTKLDLVGPQPPTAPPAGTNPLAVGNTLLIPAWTATGDIDVAGYDFFCAPVAGGDAATSAAASGFGAGAGAVAAEAASPSTSGGAICSDASADGEVSDASDDACSSGSTASATTDAATVTDSGIAVAVPACGPLGTGVPPTADQLSLLCGSVTGATATSFSIIGLTNDVQYEVAVGAVDAVGNVGPIGLANCATPQLTVGFTENYQNAGGTAGGGFCSVGRVLPGRAGWSWGVGSLLGLGLALSRRRRPQASS